MSIKYNTDFQRWEVYGDNPVIRAGESQPRFVGSFDKCEAYVKKMEAQK